MLIQSTLLSQASGSAGGLIISRTTGGLTLRPRGQKIETQTTYRSYLISIFSRLSDAWAHTLTSAQRATWSAASTPHQPHHGSPTLHPASPRGAFFTANYWRLRLRKPLILSGPPAPFTSTLRPPDPPFSNRPLNRIDLAWPGAGGWPLDPTDILVARLSDQRPPSAPNDRNRYFQGNAGSPGDPNVQTNSMQTSLRRPAVPGSIVRLRVTAYRANGIITPTLEYTVTI